MNGSKKLELRDQFNNKPLSFTKTLKVSKKIICLKNIIWKATRAKVYSCKIFFESMDVRQLVINPRVEATPFLYIGNRSRNFFPNSDFK